MRQDVYLLDLGDYYDFVIDDSGDMQSQYCLESTIITSIFTDARATPEQVVQPERRRGWIGSLNRDFEIGSLLWLYSQSRSDSVDLTGIEDAVTNSPQHLIEDGIVNKIRTELLITEDFVTLSASIYRLDDKVDYSSYNLVSITGVPIALRPS